LTANLLYSSATKNRSTLIDLLASRFTHLTQHDADLAVATILSAMNEAMARGHRIEIRGFGSFTVVHRAPRQGRNPRTGESVQIPEMRVPHFKPGKALRTAVGQHTTEMHSVLLQDKTKIGDPIPAKRDQEQLSWI
jgi:integration host factor subunit beta